MQQPFGQNYMTVSRMDVRANGRKHGWTDGRTGGRMDERTRGRAEGRTFVCIARQASDGNCIQQHSGFIGGSNGRRGLDGRQGHFLMRRERHVRRDATRGILCVGRRVFGQQ